MAFVYRLSLTKKEGEDRAYICKTVHVVGNDVEHAISKMRAFMPCWAEACVREAVMVMSVEVA